jgi:hypothetical protein
MNILEKRDMRFPKESERNIPSVKQVTFAFPKEGALSRQSQKILIKQKKEFLGLPI